MHEVQFQTNAEFGKFWWEVVHQLKASIEQKDVAGFSHRPRLGDRAQVRKRYSPVLHIF
jgi:hypothetical protein